MLDVRRLRVLREVAARGLVLRRGRGARLHAVGRLPADRGARARGRDARSSSATRAASGSPTPGARSCATPTSILARLADAEAELEAIAGLRGGRAAPRRVPERRRDDRARRRSPRFRERHPGSSCRSSRPSPSDAIGCCAPARLDIALTVDDDFRPPPSRRHRAPHAARRPDVRRAARASHPLARQAARSSSPTSPTSTWILGTTGTLPGRLRSSCARASARASSRGSPSTPTTTTRSRASSPPAWASSLIPDLALINVRDDIVVRSLGAPAADAAYQRRDARRLYRSPAKQAMLDVLLEVGAEFAGGRRELSLAS